VEDLFADEHPLAIEADREQAETGRRVALAAELRVHADESRVAPFVQAVAAHDAHQLPHEFPRGVD
jgi:hypothetical protein